MSRSVTLLGYALLVVSAGGLEVAARRRGSATFGDALDDHPAVAGGAAGAAGRMALARMAPLRSRRLAMTAR